MQPLDPPTRTSATLRRAAMWMPIKVRKLNRIELHIGNLVCVNQFAAVSFCWWPVGSVLLAQDHDWRLQTIYCIALLLREK